MALATLAIAVIAGVVDATFASSAGFSGRNADCSVCHVSPALSPATATLVGVPESWMPGVEYELTASVSGGPDSLLPGRPQGGFELEAEGGKLSPGQGMEGKTRTPSAGTITYEPEGTFQREWSLIWTAPQYQEPRPINLWLAVLSANGDHDPELNISDGGERGDSVATMSVEVPPSQAAVDGWRALPLLPPTILEKQQSGGQWFVAGEHRDGNATHVKIMRDGKELLRQTGPTWKLVIEGDLHGVQIFSQGAGRESPAVTLADDKPASALGLVSVVGLLGVALAWQKRSAP